MGVLLWRAPIFFEWRFGFGHKGVGKFIAGVLDDPVYPEMRYIFGLDELQRHFLECSKHHAAHSML